jgi:uncharacterized protein YbjT (DUF2867 family)
MPTLVTGAATPAGRACVRALLRGGGEVRAYLDPETAAEGTVDGLRAFGVKTARGALDDEGRLELACEQVHTVVHAAADPLTAPVTVLDDLATVASAALGAGCRRLVLVSHLGVDDPGDNQWLASLAEAEELAADSPVDTVVLRRSLTYGADDPLTEALIAGAAGADLEALHAPLWIDDLAAAVVAADARDREDGVLPHLVVPLGGPRACSLGELVALLGGQVTGGLRSSIARAVPGQRRLPPHVADLLSRDLLPPTAAPSAGTSPEVGAEQVRTPTAAPGSAADDEQGRS